MNLILYICGIILLLSVLTLVTAYICFRIAFFASGKKKEAPEEYSVPQGAEYEPYHEQMIAWMKEARNLPQEDVYITSFDGLKLHGKYYEYAPGPLSN